MDGLPLRGRTSRGRYRRRDDDDDDDKLAAAVAVVAVPAPVMGRANAPPSWNRAVGGAIDDAG